MAHRTYPPFLSLPLGWSEVVSQARFLTPADLLQVGAVSACEPLYIDYLERIRQLALWGRDCILVGWPDGVFALLDWESRLTQFVGCVPIDAATLYLAYCDCREYWEVSNGWDQ